MCMADSGDEELWDDVAAAGKTFCEFLDAEIQAKFARDREAAKTKTSQSTTEPTE
jgi:hypothetical protein